MPPDHRRADRVAEAIRKDTSMFFADGVKDPRLIAIVTVTTVDVSQDLRSARIYVSMMGTESEKASSMDALASLKGHLRSRLARTLRLRLAPEISFHLDESVARAARIESLLAQVRDPKPGDEGTP